MGPGAGQAHAQTEPTIPKPRTDFDWRAAGRQAFDLDARDNPMRRTGAGEIRVSELTLPPDED